MKPQFTTSKQCNSSHTLLPEESTKTPTETVHEENVEIPEETASLEQNPDVTTEQLRVLVLDAFDSASSQLHAPNGDGILESIAAPAETITRGSANGPQSPRLVEINTHGAEQTKPSKTQVRFLEPQKASRGSFLYLPGLGFVYQDDDDELGKEASKL